MSTQKSQQSAEQPSLKKSETYQKRSSTTKDTKKKWKQDWYGCESWTVKKAEHQRIDAFELWCWRRFLRVLWTARRSKQSILKEINPWCPLQGKMLKLKLQYFGHLMQRVDSLEKSLMRGGIGAGGEGDDRRWNGWMASPTGWTWVWVNSGSWWWTGRPGVLR